MNLITLTLNIWKPKCERQGILPEYKPVFARYIGADDLSKYQDILKTWLERATNCPYAVFFDRSIPLKAEFELISYVGKELKNMDVSHMESQDISLFQQEELNHAFLAALGQVVRLAISQEGFANQSTRNDFILKLIVWTYSYICPIGGNIETAHSPKCIYYGDIERHETYFLMMLYLMGFDVICLNPLRDNPAWETDSMNLCEKKSSLQIMRIDPIHEVVQNAKLIEENRSATMQLQQEIEETLFQGSGVYRPWQFRDGNTKPLFLHSTIYDLQAVWEEPARVRTGFGVNGKTVTVPNLFFQIDGTYSDMGEYQKMIQMCAQSPLTLVIGSNRQRLISRKVSNEEKLMLTFCLQGDGSFSTEELKKLPFYQWDKYRDDLEDFLLGKINDLISDCMFKKKLSRDEQFSLVCNILLINEPVIKLADNFDFTGKIPKIVAFLDNEDEMDDEELEMLGFLSEVGFDIAVFSPAGFVSIDTVFDTSRFNSVRLDEMRYDCNFDSVMKKKPKGFFQKIFG